MKEIKLFPLVGEFAEDKDVARAIRLDKITPLIEKASGEIILDFEGIKTTTQSFIHALISDLIRKYEAGVLDRILFRNCNEVVRKIIMIVSDYMQG